MTPTTSRPHTGRRRAGEHGFTLIEMVVGIALMALLMALLATSLGLARQALAGLTRATAVLPVDSAQSYLRQLVAGTIVTQRLSPGGDRELTFAGTGTGLTFTTTFAARSQLDGLYRVELRLQPAAGGGREYELVVVHGLERSAAAATATVPNRTTRLIGNIQAANFSYLPAADGTRPAEWREGFAGLDRLPRSVALDLTFVAGDTRQWPRLVMPIAISDQTRAACPPRGSC